MNLIYHFNNKKVKRKLNFQTTHDVWIIQFDKSKYH
jgi:hypothetical protein